MQTEPKTSLNRDYVRSIPQDMWPRCGWIAGLMVIGSLRAGRKRDDWRTVGALSTSALVGRQLRHDRPMADPLTSRLQTLMRCIIEEPLLGQLLQFMGWQRASTLTQVKGPQRSIGQSRFSEFGRGIWPIRFAVAWFNGDTR